MTPAPRAILRIGVMRMPDRTWSRDDIAAMDNDWVLLHLILSYKADWEDRDRGKWSDETCDLWNEATARMKEPVFHDFDKKEYMDKLNEEYEGQCKILKSAQHDYSYHYGIKSGLDIAMREFRKAVRKGEKKNETD